MRRTAQPEAWPGHLSSPSQVPSPQNPVGRKREHRKDSRQWSIGSSKSRQNTLQASASVPGGQIPSPKAPAGQTRVYTPVRGSRQCSVSEQMSDSRPEQEARERQTSASQQPAFNLEHSSAPDLSTVNNRHQIGPSRILQKPFVPRERRMLSSKVPARTVQQTRACAPGQDFMQLSSSNSSADESYSRAIERASMRSSGTARIVNVPTSKRDGKRPILRDGPEESTYLDNRARVHQSHVRLNTMLNAPRRYKSVTFDTNISVAPQPMVRSQSTSFAQKQYGYERPAWASIGHHRMVSWPNEAERARSCHQPRQKQAGVVVEKAPREQSDAREGYQSRQERRASDTSTMSRWRDDAIEAVIRKSVEVERYENIPPTVAESPPPIPSKSSRQNLRGKRVDLPHYTIRATHPAHRHHGHRVATASMLRRSQYSYDSTSSEEESMGRGRWTATSSNTAMDSVEGEERVIKPSRFVEHLGENAEKLAALGIVRERTRGSSWFRSLKRKPR